MSKIESALEKAAVLRGGLKQKNVRDVSPPAEHAPLHLVTPGKIKVSHPLLVAGTESCGLVAEEYRKLKSVIMQLMDKNDFHNTLMVTSSLCSEGKSITSMNLAMSLACEEDHTVLLIDADLRKPSLASYLGIEAEAGLSECIAGRVDISDVIIKTGIGRLSFLPAGKKVESAVELFSSQKVRELFLNIKNRYRDRYVIIDSPPILPFAESRVLGTIVDGVVLVVREGVPSTQDIMETVECLKETNLLGIVYNDVSGETRSNHYYSYSY